MDGWIRQPGPLARKQRNGREAAGSPGAASGKAAAGDRDVHDRTNAPETGRRDPRMQRGSRKMARLPRPKKAKGNDDEGYRAEFIRLVESARLLAKSDSKVPEEQTGSH